MGIREYVLDCEKKKGMEIGFKKGHKKGQREGREETKLAIVRRLLQGTDFSIPKIAYLAGASVYYVRQAKKALA